MGKWKVRRTVCKRCGMTVAESLLWIHRRSLLHRRYHEIKRLIEGNVVTLAEIAARYGVSKEWVSQVSERMGIPGRDRQKQRTMRKLQTSPRLVRLLEDLRAQGLNVSPLVIFRRGGNVWVPRRRVLVNGRMCAVIKATVRNERLVRLHYQKTHPAEFVLVQMPDHWLVIPVEEAPHDTTILSPHLARLAPGSGGRKHDWNKYLDAWHLLKRA